MSISNYSELKTAVANWLHDTNLTSYIPDFIRLGEARVYRELRIRALETALSDTISSGALSVPSSYVEMKVAYIDGSPVQFLERMPLEQLYVKYPQRASSGKPYFYAREAENFIFGPYPDSDYTVKGVYYQGLTALSDNNTTNWFVTHAPDILLFAALAEAAPFLQDDGRVKLWEAKYQSVKQQLDLEDKMEGVSGSTPRVHIA